MNHVRSEEVLHSAKEERNIIDMAKRRKANWIGLFYSIPFISYSSRSNMTGQYNHWILNASLCMIFK
jgi:hypothetical protein